MKTIVVKSQSELDALPKAFDEFTLIEIRSSELINVVARDNSSVVARENSRVEARENSRVLAWENSRVLAWENSHVVAWDNSSVVAWENSHVVARDNSSVVARENSRVVAWGNSHVVAWENSHVVARENSRVVARENSHVEAYDFSVIIALSIRIIISKLMDYSVASLRGVPSSCVKEKSKTATIINAPSRIERTFDEWLAQGYVHADGIKKKLISKKKIKDVEVFEVEEFLERTSSYVVKRGDVFSHGETIAKAKADLKYKIGTRDTSQFKNWKLTDKKKVEDLIQAYRVITGACELGVKQFCEGRKLKDKITVKEAIKLTEGSYGADKFEEFFK